MTTDDVAREIIEWLHSGDYETPDNLSPKIRELIAAALKEAFKERDEFKRVWKVSFDKVTVLLEENQRLESQLRKLLDSQEKNG